MEQQNSPLLIKIDTLRSKLPATEGKVAGYILAHPREVIYLSITGLAANCGVSDATVVRFCKRLGLHGYQALKVRLAQDIVSPLERIHEGVQETDTCQEILAKVFQTTIHALQYTLRIIDEDQFIQTVDALDKAQRVAIFGLGNSASVARDAQHKLLRLGINATAYDDNHIQRMVSVNLRAGDVCLCISHSGSSRDIVDAGRNAKSNGAKVIALVGIGESPLSEVADIRLDTSAREAQYHILALSSRIAQYALIDALYTCIAMKRRTDEKTNSLLIERVLEPVKH